MNRKQYYIIYNKYQQKLERQFVKIIQKALKAQYKFIANKINNGVAPLNAVDYLPSMPIYEAIKELYITSIKSWGKRVFQIQTAKTIVEKRIGKPFSYTDALLEIINSKINNNLLDVIEDINTTTKKKIIKIIRKGIEDEISINKVAKEIEDLGLSNVRAMRIARTETVSILNLTTYEMAKNLKYDVKKEWLFTLDKRTRHSHKNLMFKEVELYEPFKIGDSWLQYPGDKNKGLTPPEEVVNCRCTIIIIPK